LDNYSNPTGFKTCRVCLLMSIGKITQYYEIGALSHSKVVFACQSADPAK